MFVSTVAPVADTAHGDSDLDIRSSTPHEDVSERDCKFKNSGIYKVIRYPVLLMNFCGIYVPSCCVCQVNRKLSQSKSHFDPECPDFSIKTLIYVKSVDGRPEQAKVVRGQQCPNMDGRKWSLVKKVTTAVMFLVNISNTIRYVFILKYTSSDVNAYVFSVTSYFILSFYFYLLAAGSHANYAHFSAYIAALSGYDRTYILKCDFLRQARKQLWMFCAGLAFQFVQSVLLVYGMVELFDGFSVQLWPFSFVDNDWRVAIGLFCGVAVFFASGNVYGTHLFRTVVTSMLRIEFVHLAKEFRELLSRPIDRNNEEAFDKLLRKFQEVCQLRDKSYHVIKHTVASSYFFSVPLVCFVLYGLVSGALQLDQMLILAFNIAMAVVILIHTTWSLASLNSEATSVSQCLYQGHLESFSKSLFQKAVLLTNMITTNNMGMTVYGLFVVDWSTFLMVFGTMLTYAVVVIQFQTGTPVCHCHTNMTS
nr:CAunnamed protein product [Biomphalaria glabrata]